MNTLSDDIEQHFEAKANAIRIEYSNGSSPGYSLAERLYRLGLIKQSMLSSASEMEKL